MSHRETIPYAPTDELIDLGVLQEANRRFFHLLGLELVATVEDDGSHTLRVVDERDQRGGLVFSHEEPEWSEIRRARAREVERLLAARTAERQKVRGFEVQSMEEL